MKKWVRENYTIEKMFSCWGRNYYIYPVTYQGNIYTVCLNPFRGNLYGSIYAYKDHASGGIFAKIAGHAHSNQSKIGCRHRGKKLYFTDISCIIRDNSIFIDEKIEVSSYLDEEDILTYLPQLVKVLFELYREQLKKEKKKEKKKEISANWNGKLD